MCPKTTNEARIEVDHDEIARGLLIIIMIKRISDPSLFE